MSTGPDNERLVGRITEQSTVVHNYKFFYYLANEMAYLAQREASREGAVALDEYRYSIASVIFSFTYIEGYVHHLMYGPDSPVQDLFSGMSEEEKGQIERLPLFDGIEYLAFHHPGSETSKPERGREPYQSFLLLTKLRNLLIHYKPELEIKWSLEEDYRKAFEKLEKQIGSKFAFNEKMQGQVFVYRCFSSDCASWAFKASREFTDWLSETLSVERPSIEVHWPLG